MRPDGCEICHSTDNYCHDCCTCFDCLDKERVAAQEEIQKWKALASQINTDWVPANQQLTQQISTCEAENSTLKVRLHSIALECQMAMQERDELKRANTELKHCNNDLYDRYQGLGKYKKPEIT